MISKTTPLAPRQERSRRSLEGLLAAAEVEIAQHGFEKASVASICRRAGLTTGAFYSRFAHKSELVAALVERFAAEAGALMRDLQVPPHSLHAAIRDFAAGLVNLYRRRLPLVRALEACVHGDPEGERSMRELHGAMVDYLTELLLSLESEFSAPQPALAARLGVIVAVETAMEVVVHRRLSTAGGHPFTDEQLVEELAQLLSAYFAKA